MEKSIKNACKTYCSELDYTNFVELGRGMHSIVFKATEIKSGNLVCFKIIPEKEYSQSPEEWKIINLLRKFFEIVFFKFKIIIEKAISLLIIMRRLK
jgi:hypothetical protein